MVTWYITLNEVYILNSTIWCNAVIYDHYYTLYFLAQYGYIFYDTIDEILVFNTILWDPKIYIQSTPAPASGSSCSYLNINPRPIQSFIDHIKAEYTEREGISNTELESLNLEYKCSIKNWVWYVNILTPIVYFISAALNHV
jgi:hypothetical protein